MNEIEEYKLLEQFCKHNDKKALGLLFNMYLDHLFRVAFIYCSNQADAEDVVQKLFMQILRKGANVRGMEEKNNLKIKAWFTKSCINMAKMSLRKKKSIKEGESKVIKKKSITEAELSTKNHNIPDLETMLSSLPINYRLPIKLKYQENLSYDEISEILNLKCSTVRSKVKRGLDILRKNLGLKGGIASLILILSNIKSQKLMLAPAHLKINSFDHSFLNKVNENSSFHVKVNSKAKAIFASALICSLAILSHYYLMTNKAAQANSSSVSTKDIWDFKENIKDDFTVLRGSWQWDSNEGKMVIDEKIEPDTPVFVKFKTKYNLFQHFQLKIFPIFSALKPEPVVFVQPFISVYGNTTISKIGDNQIRNKVTQNTSLNISTIDFYILGSYILLKEDLSGSTMIFKINFESKEGLFDYLLNLDQINLFKIIRQDLKLNTFIFNQIIPTNLNFITPEEKQRFLDHIEKLKNK